MKPTYQQLQEIREIAGDMRSAQRTYFVFRNANDLNRAKAHEKTLDKRLEALFVQEAQEPSLFDGEDDHIDSEYEPPATE